MPRQYNAYVDFDTGYLSEFRPQIDSLAEAHEDVELNLSSVNFVDSDGIGALVTLHQKLLAKGHRLKVVGLRGQPLQCFLSLQLIPALCDPS